MNIVRLVSALFVTVVLLLSAERSDAMTNPSVYERLLQNIESHVSDSVRYISIYFPFDNYMIDKNYMDNAKELESLHHILKDSLIGSSGLIIVVGSTSPEGDYIYNVNLAEKRANAIRNYILREFIHIKPEDIQTNINEDYWENLKSAVTKDPNFPDKEAFLQMLNDPDRSDEATGRMITTMNQGVFFNYLKDHGILKSLRKGDISIESYPPVPVKAKSETVPLYEPSATLTPSPIRSTRHESTIKWSDSQRVKSKPISFALRTNLLFDILGGPNIGIDISIGDHISVGGDFSYIYTRFNNTYALQSIQGTLEGRYWFKNTSNEFTGWNAGLYTTYCSRFDIQWRGGYQGDGYWSAGFSGGYSWPLSDTFNLGVSAMAGILYISEYRQYSKPQEGHLMWKETHYNAIRFLPTMIRLDLVWLLKYDWKKR